YAFPENFKVEKPVIKVAIKRLDELKYSLIISDNGIGISADYDQRQSKSLGLQLVNSLVAQIEGDLKVISEKGIEYRIVFIDRNKVRTKQT
ncbi:MAG: sensor histidine kinase, partial [Ignavibacteriae bacterium]|nr:sensor histidine kinase [Ignavibacteriota bacterium]